MWPFVVNSVICFRNFFEMWFNVVVVCATLLGVVQSTQFPDDKVTWQTQPPTEVLSSKHAVCDRGFIKKTFTHFSVSANNNNKKV
jgi:hypothetical protein